MQEEDIANTKGKRQRTEQEENVQKRWRIV